MPLSTDPYALSGRTRFFRAAKKHFHKVGVLKGGVSSEADISLKSGTAVAKGLRDAGYEVVETHVRRRALDLAEPVEAVFVALHGDFGEDGQVQALLESVSLVYCGAGPAASAVGMDKTLFKRICG